MTEPLVRIKNLSRYYGDYCAVDGISFDLYPGEVLGFLGPNGAGKSTTMGIISGCLAPTRGEVLLNGVDLLKQPGEAKRELGFLPEHPPLYREMKVDEYLRYCGRLHKITSDRLTEAVERAKQRCGLTDHGGRLIDNLSKGYQQRLGIAQAIIHDPKVIILDEPSSGLDPNQIKEIRSLIRELGKSCAIIISTHILPEVEAICDRVQILHRGRLVFSEYLETLNNRESKLLITLGNPPPIDQLQALPGIVSVEALDEKSYRIMLEAGADPALIAEASSSNGWLLRQLTPEQQNLERIFTQLTTGEAE